MERRNWVHQTLEGGSGNAGSGAIAKKFEEIVVDAGHFVTVSRRSKV